MLFEEIKDDTATPYIFRYVKGEIHLVLIKSNTDEPKWVFRQDIEDNVPVLRSKLYTFGNRYGILTKKENKASILNIQGRNWDIGILPNGMPILKNNKSYPKYIRLHEVV